MNVLGKYRATSDYQKKNGNELSLTSGDIVEVLKKGKYIWYGRVGADKGFFPCIIVEELEKQALDNNKDNSLSTNAALDNESISLQSSDGSISHSVQEIETTDKTFKDIEETLPLEDKRRSRPKSAGRPPSVVFIKENILQRSTSMEYLGSSSDDDKSITQEADIPTVSTKTTSVSQLILELKQKPQLKTVIQKDSISGSNVKENCSRVPGWINGLPKRKLSAPNPPREHKNSDAPPPWMQELRKRKEHKLSLISEDETQLASQEFRASQESSVNYNAIERRSVEILTTNKVTMKEKGNIRNLEIEETSGKTTAKHTYSFSQNSETKATKVENIQSNFQKSKLSTEIEINNSRPKVTVLTSSTNATQVTASIDSGSCPEVDSFSPKNDCKTDVYKDKLQPTKPSKDLNSNDNLVSLRAVANNASQFNKIEINKHTILNSEETLTSTEKLKNSTKTPTLQMAQLDANESSKHEYNYKDKVKNTENPLINEQSTSKVCSDDKIKAANSIQSLLSEIEELNIKHKLRSTAIHQNLLKLEEEVDQQYQELITVIKTTKAKLSSLIES